MEFEIEERTILILELIQVEKNVKLYLKVMIATYILLLSLTFLNVSVGNIMIVTAVAIMNAAVGEFQDASRRQVLLVDPHPEG